MTPARAGAVGCAGQSLAQTFLPWTDPAWYTPLPDSGFEWTFGAWTLARGAHLVAENEPYYVDSPDDQWSLQLPAGSSAVSAAQCVGVGHPTIRFFARNTGASEATLSVSVVFLDAVGTERSLPIGAITAGPAWAPTPPLPVTVNTLSLLGVQAARFAFDPSDGGGVWSIDDVYVDPYGKG
jgi:hypothetical protein